MKVKSIKDVVCLAVLALAPTQQIGRAQEPVSGATSAETLFAYRSSIYPSHRPDPLYGLAIIPFDVPVELSPEDSQAWAQAKLDSTVTLRVVSEVAIKGEAITYAGTLIEARVTRIRKGNLRVRHGRLETRVQEITLGKSLRFSLESSPGRDFDQTARKIASFPSTAFHYVVVLPAEWVLLGIACSTTGCDL